MKRIFVKDDTLNERDETARYIDRQVTFQLGALSMEAPSFRAGFAPECAARASICALYDPSSNELTYSPKWKGPLDDKRLRIDRFLTHIDGYAPRFPVFCDLQDAVPRVESQLPTFQYVRRPGARNAVLWPLAGYHEIGTANFVGGESQDTIPFADKVPKAFWRGTLSGHIVKDGRLVNILFVARDYLAGRIGEDELLQSLMQTPRYRFVARYFDDPDFDVGFVSNLDRDFLLAIPLFARFMKPWADRRFHHTYRYQVALSGNDASTSFPWMLETNSLVLREAYMWEVMFDCHLQPDQHYLSLDDSFLKTGELVRWCNAHPHLCEDMIARAQAVTHMMRNEAVYQEILHRVVEEMNRRFAVMDTVPATKRPLPELLARHPERLRLLHQMAQKHHPAWAEQILAQTSHDWPLATRLRYEQHLLLQAIASGHEAHITERAATLLDAVEEAEAEMLKFNSIDVLLQNTVRPLLDAGAREVAERCARLAFRLSPERFGFGRVYLKLLLDADMIDECLELVDHLASIDIDALYEQAGKLGGPKAAQLQGRILALAQMESDQRASVLAARSPGPWLDEILSTVPASE